MSTDQYPAPMPPIRGWCGRDNAVGLSRQLLISLACLKKNGKDEMSSSRNQKEPGARPQTVWQGVSYIDLYRSQASDRNEPDGTRVSMEVVDLSWINLLLGDVFISPKCTVQSVKNDEQNIDAARRTAARLLDQIDNLCALVDDLRSDSP